MLIVGTFCILAFCKISLYVYEWRRNSFLNSRYWLSAALGCTKSSFYRTTLC